MSMATDAETLPDRGEARLQLAEDADAELLGAAVHAGGPGGSAAVLHGDGLDVPWRWSWPGNSRSKSQRLLKG